MENSQTTSIAEKEEIEVTSSFFELLIPTSVSATPSDKPDVMSEDVSCKRPLPPTSNFRSAPRLTDLPVEILHHIAGYLWVKKEYANWYYRFEEFRHYAPHETRAKGRKEVLSFSSCSKDLRQLFFQDSMVKEVTVNLERKKLSDLQSLPDHLKRSIR